MNSARAPLPPLIGCGLSPIEAHYEKMKAGDPASLAAARRLADREASGRATAAEKSALWGLRALHDEPDEPSDAATQRCIALLASAQRGTLMYGQHGQHGQYGQGYAVNPIPMNPFNPGAQNPAMHPMGAFSGGGPAMFGRGGGGGGGHGGGGGFARGGGGFHGGHPGGFARGGRGFANGGGGFPFGYGYPYGYGYGYDTGCQYVQTPYGLQLACPPQYAYPSAYGI